VSEAPAEIVIDSPAAEVAREALGAGDEAWVVGGAVRDAVLDIVTEVDLAVAGSAAEAARAISGAAGAHRFELSGEFATWRVAARDGTWKLDIAELRGATIEEDLRLRDFTVNAIAVPVAGGGAIDPYDGRADAGRRTLRRVTDEVFDADPLRLLRAVRLEDELGFRLDEETERLVRDRAPLVRDPSGERILAELERLSLPGWLRLDELGLLEALGGSAERLREGDQVDAPRFRLVAAFGADLGRFPISNDLRRYGTVLGRAEPPADGSPRAIHRFRRATEPFAVDALQFVHAPWHLDAVLAARAQEPAEPLLRGDELDLPPGPEIGRMLDLVAEERAAGTVTTKEEALELVRRGPEAVQRER
jgi:hypothetical protein